MTTAKYKLSTIDYHEESPYCDVCETEQSTTHLPVKRKGEVVNIKFCGSCITKVVVDEIVVVTPNKKEQQDTSAETTDSQDHQQDEQDDFIVTEKEDDSEDELSSVEEFLSDDSSETPNNSNIQTESSAVVEDQVREYNEQQQEDSQQDSHRTYLLSLLEYYEATDVDSLGEPTVQVTVPVLTIRDGNASKNLHGSLRIIYQPDSLYLDSEGLNNYVETILSAEVTPDQFVKLLYSDLNRLLQPDFVSIRLEFNDAAGYEQIMELNTPEQNN